MSVFNDFVLSPFKIKWQFHISKMLRQDVANNLDEFAV